MDLQVPRLVLLLARQGNLMTIQVPSIWDYLAQAGNQGVSSYYDAKNTAYERVNAERIRKAQEDAMFFQMMMQGAQSGQVDAATVNALPLAQQRGFRLMPSSGEVARKITLSPQGMPTVVGQGSAGGLPVPIMSRTPWSDDQRRFAKLPTADEMTVEKGAAAQATATIEDARFAPFRRELEGAAERYVAGAIPPELELNPRNFAIAAKGAAERAYGAWLKDQGTQGAVATKDPGVQNYARSFFDQAVQKRMREMYELQQMNARANNWNSGSGSEDPTRWYRAVQSSVTNLSAERARLVKPFEFDLGSPAGQTFLERNPAWLAVKPQIEAIDSRLEVLKMAGNSILQGVMTPEITQLLQSLDAGAIVTTARPDGAPGAAPAASAVKDMPPDRRGDLIRQFTQALQGAKTDADRAKVQNLFSSRFAYMSLKDRQAIASATGLTP